MGLGTLRRYHPKASAPEPTTEPDTAPDWPDADTAAADADETPAVDEPEPTGTPDAPEPQAADSEPVAPERPKGNASLEAWTAYALANGYTTDDLADAGRDQIAALFKD